MVTIVNVNSTTFSINGIEYLKNFMSIVDGNNVKILNVYDSKVVLQEPTIYSDYTVDAVGYGSAALLQAALKDVLFYKVVTPTITANTGTVISLTNVIGNICNMASANPTTTYTTTGTTAGANAIVLINATSEPTITGATKIKGNDFIINTDMHLVVQYLGVTVQYFFIEL